MRIAVLQGARDRGSVRMNVHHADNYWAVNVNADGTTSYEGYAQETRGPSGDVTDLTLWELAHLLQTLTEQ